MQRKKRYYLGNKGFKYIEVALVLGVTAILALIVVPNVIRAREEMQEKSCRANIISLNCVVDLAETAGDIEDPYNMTNAQMYANIMALGYMDKWPECPAHGAYVWDP